MIFEWLSNDCQRNLLLLRVCFTSICDWFKKLPPFCYEIEVKSRPIVSFSHALIFPSLGPCYQHILWDLIGLLGNLYLLWLVRFIWKVLKALVSNTNISLTVQWPYLWFYNCPALTSLTSPGARVMQGVLGFFQLPKMRFRAVMYRLYKVSCKD